MSEHRFTEGNLIILYAIYRGRSADGRSLPDYLLERVQVCLDTLRIITRSKPDKHKTTIVVVTNLESAGAVKEALLKGGVDEKMIVIDSIPKNIAQTFNRVLGMVKSLTNPPHIYYVGSVWQRDIYDSIVISRFKGYRIQFDGALDHRPVREVEQERAFEAPKKNSEYYKKKAKDKGIDMLLNYIFPEK
ncbi:MAG: hypothetical protein WA667_02480 [Candidatus Nitrosopolaris sp.]